MNLLIITYAANAVLMIAMPIGLAIFLTKRWSLGINTWWIGAATFVISQVGHIPFNWLAGKVLNGSSMVYWAPLAQALFNATFLGLSAGLFEELSRYLVLRLWARPVRSWRMGVVFGAGHGGLEAILLGLLALYGYIQLVILQAADPQELNGLVGASRVDLVQAQLTVAWSAPWYATFLGSLERLLTIPVHIFLAVLVMQVFIRNQTRWLILAVVYHAFLDALLVFLRSYLSAYWLEALLGIFTVASIAFTFALFKPEPEKNPVPVIPGQPLPVLQPVVETTENLDDTRYQG